MSEFHSNQLPHLPRIKLRKISETNKSKKRPSSTAVDVMVSKFLSLEKLLGRKKIIFKRSSNHSLNNHQQHNGGHWERMAKGIPNIQLNLRKMNRKSSCSQHFPPSHQLERNGKCKRKNKRTTKSFERKQSKRRITKQIHRFLRFHSHHKRMPLFSYPDIKTYRSVFVRRKLKNLYES
ncbi:hypothetical protein SNEBB_004627 [Seison nebaliae]|nr:hypothetical protein SNEBB_004627 [Seison nebaliae]